MKKIYTIILFVLYNSILGQCLATVTITGIYNTTYTGSNSWIATSGVTTIPTGVNVTLDANPSTYGFVLLDTGFETQSSAIFLAVVQTPCSLLSTNQNVFENDFKIYPNPTADILNIDYVSNIDEVNVINILGQALLTQKSNTTSVSIDLSKLTASTYFVKIVADGKSKVIKILKQ